MPPLLSEADHFAQAAHNEATFVQLRTLVVPVLPQATDWALVMLFYAAMHHAKACLLRDFGDRPTKHASFRDRETGEMVHGTADCVSKRYGTEPSVAYHALYDLGRAARYQPLFRAYTDMDEIDQILMLQARHLDALKTGCAAA